MLKKIKNFLDKNEIEILSQYWKLNKKSMKPCQLKNIKMF